MMKDKFVVLAHPRCGSTHFCCNVLSKHPEVACFDEVFNEQNTTSRADMEAIGLEPYYLAKRNPTPRYVNELHFLDELSKTAAVAKRKPIVGAKVFLYQVPELTLMHILDTMKVIVLKRQNVVQAAISFAIAFETDHWHAPVKHSFEPFRLDFEQLLRFINYRIGGLNECERYLNSRKIPYLPLQYETLFSPETLRSVEAFLGLDASFNIDNFGKTKLNDNRRYELIENIDEIRTKFIGLGYPDVYETVYEYNLA